MEITADEISEGDLLVDYHGTVTGEPIHYGDVMSKCEMVAVPMGRAIQHMPASEYVRIGR
jgi:hypothetical protein